MGKGAVLALRTLQWFNRAVQFGSCALVLAVYSYFLATMSNHNIDIPTYARAVEGIAGIGVVYTAAGLALLCCLAGRTFFSFLAMLLDLCFIGAFIYVAIQNRDGASSCTGQVSTIYGDGDADSNVSSGSGGSNAIVLPNLRLACKLETACLAVSIIACVFFVFSMLTELGLGRLHKKEQRIGPSPANGYTSGYGSAMAGGAGGGRVARHDDELVVNHEEPKSGVAAESPDADTYPMNTYGTATEQGPAATSTFGQHPYAAGTPAASAGYGAGSSSAAGLGGNKYAPENYVGSGYAAEELYGSGAATGTSPHPRADNPYRS